jgi:hypothetical protein
MAQCETKFSVEVGPKAIFLLLINVHVGYIKHNLRGNFDH